MVGVWSREWSEWVDVWSREWGSEGSTIRSTIWSAIWSTKRSAIGSTSWSSEGSSKWSASWSSEGSSEWGVLLRRWVVQFGHRGVAGLRNDFVVWLLAAFQLNVWFVVSADGLRNSSQIFVFFAVFRINEADSGADRGWFSPAADFLSAEFLQKARLNDGSASQHSQRTQRVPDGHGFAWSASERRRGSGPQHPGGGDGGREVQREAAGLREGLVFWPVRLLRVGRVELVVLAAGPWFVRKRIFASPEKNF